MKSKTARNPVADCHVHIFDPARFPYSADTDHTPLSHETAPLEALNAVMDAHDVSHALIVTPTAGYGADNSAALNAICRFPERFRGISVVPPDATLEELSSLKSSGVVGVRIDLMQKGVAYFETVLPLLGRLNELDMVIQIQTERSELSRTARRLVNIPGRIVFDHMGRPDPKLGVDHDDFRALLQLAGREKTYVKLSGPFRYSRAGYPYLDGDAYARAILRAFTPSHCVWGSDWPFVRMHQRLDYGPTLNALERWCEREDDRRTILWDTPRVLFGFGESF